jgi:hypothetical protein
MERWHSLGEPRAADTVSLMCELRPGTTLGSRPLARSLGPPPTVGFGLLALPFIGGASLILAMVIHNEQYLQVVLVLGGVTAVSAIIFAGAYLVTHELR